LLELNIITLCNILTENWLWNKTSYLNCTNERQKLATDSTGHKRILQWWFVRNREHGFYHFCKKTTAPSV